MTSCPIATQDIHVNLKNRDKAFKEYGYGPANPELSNGAFWNKRANEWATSIDQAKTMRCGNCSAFIQTPEMMECIRTGIDEEDKDESFAQDVIDSAKLGYCELFDFKCAADRTCSAWLVGGPIKTSKVKPEVIEDPFEDTTEEDIE
jgi:hypothetical protein